MVFCLSFWFFFVGLFFVGFVFVLFCFVFSAPPIGVTPFFLSLPPYSILAVAQLLLTLFIASLYNSKFRENLSFIFTVPCMCFRTN